MATEGEQLDDLEGFIYRIIGNMYGRIDAPKRWYIRVAKFLFDKGFRRTRITETIFVMFTANCFIIVILHVDDLRAAFRPEDASVWYSFVEELAKEFKFVKKDLGEFIGFQFIRNADGSMDESYVTSLLQEWGMLWGEYKAKTIPLNKGIVLDVVPTDDPKEANMKSLEYAKKDLLGPTRGFHFAAPRQQYDVSKFAGGIKYKTKTYCDAGAVPEH